MEEEKIQRIRCPCCDSIFEIKLAQIQFNRGKIILDKINSSTRSPIKSQHYDNLDDMESDVEQKLQQDGVD